MEPTLFNNNVVVTQMNVKHLQRGEVVVFDAKPVEDENYIKRVIGLPGDIVEIKVGHVYVNGIEIQEPYLSKDTVTEPEMMVKVPENEIFVLGDNREESQDSRFIGTIPFEKIRGRAYFRIFPLNKMGKF
jgi:signal peptidase I